MIRWSCSEIICIREGEHVRVEPYGPGVIRVRASLGEIQAENWTLLLPQEAGTAVNPDGDGGAILCNEGIAVHLSADGVLSFLNDTGKILTEEFWQPEGDIPARVLKGRGDLVHIEQTMKSFDGEHFYGLGQEAHDLFDLKGAVLDLWQRNTKSTIPFVYSSRGYGFLWNNPSIGRVEFGTSRTRWVAEAGRQLDYLVIAGKTPAEVMRRYCQLTGFSPALPYWATGLWQSKLRYETQDELLSVAREYRRRGVPISVIVCDYFHWPQQGEWKFDRRYWPDPEAMIKELSDMGVRLLVSIWPTVDPRSENYPKMREENLIVRTERGEGTIMACRGPETYYDPTNPAARSFVWGRAEENYWRLGVKNFWLDEAEPEMTPYDYENLRYWIGNGATVSSLYPYYYAKTFYDGQKACGQDEIVNLIRCAWAGSQRFGVVLWSGDIQPGFASLRRQIKTGLHVAMSGIPWWTTDIGGFQGGDPDDPSYRECLVRWFQFGAFCPVLRMHGFRYLEGRPESSPYEVNGFCYSGGPNEIWSYGEEAYRIMRNYVRIRERLRPYITDELALATKTGIPLMRPLFFDYPEEENYCIFDQYLFGPDLMVCPVYEEEVRERTVRFPAGADWIRAETGERYPGGTTSDVPAPLERIPVFIREGGSLPNDFLKML